MVIPLALVFAVTLGQPTLESLGLPPGVKGFSERYNDSNADAQLDSDTPFCRDYFEITWDWVRNEQHLPRGSFGWNMYDFTLDTMDQSLLYNVPTAKGTLDQRLDIMGNSAGETEISPIGWLRTLHVRKANGEQIHVRKEGRYTIYSCETAYNQGLLSVFVDEATNRIDKVVHEGKTKGDAGVYKYFDWKSLPGGYHHPRRIELSFKSQRAGDYRGTVFIREIEVLPADTEPTPYSFPERARFVDNIDHVTRNGLMEVVGPIEPDPPSPNTTSTGLRKVLANPRNWFVWGGVGALLLAAVAWRLKQRGIIT